MRKGGMPVLIDYLEHTLRTTVAALLAGLAKDGSAP